jgi:broad specificity phosphatase PhoE
MRIELYVRHSEAFANKDGIFSGQSHQSNLTGPGIDLAWGLAESLKRNQISSTAIQASPIRRARQTAQIISWSLRLPVIYDPLLMEINQGVWEGQPSHWVKENYPDELALWIHSPAQFSIPGGETLAQVADRVDQFRRNLHQRVPEGAVLIVTHQVWLQVMVAKICGLDLNHI